jgi:hypothetical protein
LSIGDWSNQGQSMYQELFRQEISAHCYYSVRAHHPVVKLQMIAILSAVGPQAHLFMREKRPFSVAMS